MARESGALTVCDNTFATPLVQQPLADGVDVVLHSVTKYLSGHSDVILGALVTPPTDAGRALHARLSTARLLGGAIAGPMETWLALRGLRTLHVRLERATANARELAARLEGHPAVARARYPGFGAIIAIEVQGGAEAAERVAAATTLWTHATSLGGVESQIERRRRYPAEPHDRPRGPAAAVGRHRGRRGPLARPRPRADGPVRTRATKERGPEPVAEAREREQR